MLISQGAVRAVQAAAAAAAVDHQEQHFQNIMTTTRTTQQGQEHKAMILESAANPTCYILKLRIAAVVFITNSSCCQ